ncbi:MAG: ABC transporter ATP-binding protein [Alphaproteobacteria bacterium]
MTRLAARSLCVQFGGQHALRDVSFGVGPGELIGLIGPNGAGKTTLLRALAGLLKPSAGTVTLDGRELEQTPHKERARHIGYLPQGGRSQWAISVEELVMMGRIPHLGRFGGPGPGDREVVGEVMAATDVAHLAGRPATALSGGEEARVLLARALAGEPALLLADEPVAGLDPYHRLEVMERLAGLAAGGAGVVVVLHDLTLAGRFCDRLVLLDEGRVAVDGEAGEALSDANLARVYQVRAVRGSHREQTYLVPWERLPEKEK